MNNENKPNLTDMYGPETSDTFKQNYEPSTTPEVVPRVDIGMIDSRPVTPSTQPIPQKEIKEEIEQLEVDEKKPSKKSGGSGLIVLILLIVIGFGAYKTFFSQKPVDNNQNVNEDASKKGQDSESTKETEMINIFKEYTTKIESFVQKKSYYCNNDSLLLPTRFIIEIDTSDGTSGAQANGSLVGKSKSPWNSDIKGYVIVEMQPRGESIYHINLSDGVHGVSGETELNSITKDSIKENISYPTTPTEGIKCQLGNNPNEKESNDEYDEE